MPWSKISPPASPEPGPISIISSAAFIISTLWSTTTRELPCATNLRNTLINPSTLAGCNPIEGSSKTYKTPVVSVRKVLASWILCNSPVDKVFPARAMVK